MPKNDIAVGIPGGIRIGASPFGQTIGNGQRISGGVCIGALGIDPIS